MAGGHDNLEHPLQRALWPLPPPPPSTPENRTLQLARTGRRMGDADTFPDKLVHVDHTFRHDEKNGTTRGYPPPHCVVIPVFDATRYPPHCAVLFLFDAARRYPPPRCAVLPFFMQRGEVHLSPLCFCFDMKGTLQFKYIIIITNQKIKP